MSVPHVDDFAEPAPGPRPVPGFGGLGAVVGTVLVVAVLGGLVWSATVGRATAAPHPHLFGGSLVLEDNRPLTIIDLATGSVTVRLQGVYAQVGATSYADVQAVAVQGGTILVNRRTGTFNFLGLDNYVVDTTGSGIGLGPLPGSSSASALAAGAAAYITRDGPRSAVSLVDRTTVAAGARSLQARAAGTVPPRGFASLGGPVATQPGGETVAGMQLWALVGDGASCRVTRLTPAPSDHNGLRRDDQAPLAGGCASAALETSAPPLGRTPGGSSTGDALVAVASPGQVRIYKPRLSGAADTTTDVPVPATRTATVLRPVSGAVGAWWYLARMPSGWALFSVGLDGRVGPLQPLSRLGPASEPATPVFSRGHLYTIDQAAAGDPTLWEIDASTAATVPVTGKDRYPAKGVTERASFNGAQVLVSGPRVVFNNPDSLLAVVVFTDGTHGPVTVDKSTALDVSTVGPGNADSQATTPTSAPAGHPPAPPPTTVPSQIPTPQALNQQVTCANTTQRPHAAQITAITPSAESALISWSYQLLDQQDCQPDSWAVHVTALGGTPQPARPIQTINGQNQLQFVGLRPAASYRVIVVAYINSQSTPSLPATFATATRGPDAPTSVRTRADGSGDWIVSWTPCQSASCYVPADSWTVTGSSCGSAYVGQPPAVQVPGSQTSVTINASALGLLGTLISFSVQGGSAAGLLGNPTADHACTAAWQAPNVAVIALTASATPSGQTVTATLKVTTTVPPAQAFGSDVASFTYHVGDATIGPTTQTQVTVPGLAPGATLTPTVVIAPAGHPDATVTVTGASFSQNLTWPSDLAVQAISAVNPTQPNTGSITAAVSALPAGSFTAAGQLTCGSSQVSFARPLTAGSFTIPNLNLVSMGGSNCQLTLTLTDLATPNPYGVASPPLTARVDVGTQPHYSFQVDYNAACRLVSCADLQYLVTYIGSGEPAAGANWTVTARDPSNPSCHAVSGPTASPAFPVQVDWPNACGSQTPQIIVTYEYLGQLQSVTASPPPGPPPSTTSTTTPVTTTSTTSTSTTSTSTTSTSTTTTSTTTTSTTATTTTATTTTSTTTAGAARAGVAPVNVAALAAPDGTVLAASVMPEDSQAGEEAFEWTVGMIVVATTPLVLAGRRRRARRSR